MTGSLPKDHRAITTPAGGGRRDATHGSAQNHAIGAGRRAKDAAIATWWPVRPTKTFHEPS